MAKASNPGPVGRRLRALRKENSWTLDDVARRTSISKSTLSKIENGLTNLSFTTVNKLAEGLALPITALTMPKGERTLARRSLTRLGGGTEFVSKDARYEVLCDDLAGNHQTFMKIRITARPGGKEPAWRSHPGLEFLYVLSGTLELQTEGYEPMILKTGDSIYFDSTMKHRYVSRGRKDVELLAAMQAHGYTDAEDSSSL